MNIADRVLNRFGLLRRDSLNDREIIDMLTAGSRSASGQSVTVASAMTSTVVYACVRVIAETMASLPLKLYRRGERRTEATNHPLYTVLHDRANGNQTAFEYREMLFGHLKTWGNHYSEIEMNAKGDVIGLWPLRPDRMEVKRVDGQVVYVYTMPNGGTIGLPAYRVMHVREMALDGLVGMSPIGQARNAIGLALSTEEFGGRFFANGASAGTVLKHPGKMSKEAYQRLLKSWEDRHMGLTNAMRTAILEEGIDIKTVGLPMKDAEFLETRKYQALEACRIFRVPPHKVGILDNATFSNIEHQAIEFSTDTIRPNAVRFEQVITRDLIGTRESATLYAEHVLDGLLRGDTNSRYAAYAIGRQWGWLSPNDIRHRENMDPIDGGDRYDAPLNMAPLTGAPQPEPGQPDQSAANNALRAWCADAAGRLAGRVCQDYEPRHVPWMVNVIRPLAAHSGHSDPAASAERVARSMLELKHDQTAMESYLLDFTGVGV